MTHATRTLAQFIAANRIRIRSEWTASNPNFKESDRMDHWKVTLQSGRRRMTLFYSKGHGHNGAEPTAEEVLDCLASDSSSVENANGFEDWCSEFGYDTDSRSAEETHRACERHAAKLKRLLGDEQYKALLWDTERL